MAAPVLSGLISPWERSRARENDMLIPYFVDNRLRMREIMLMLEKMMVDMCRMRWMNVWYDRCLEMMLYTTSWRMNNRCHYMWSAIHIHSPFFS
jgi:hypothetical protein